MLRLVASRIREIRARKHLRPFRATFRRDVRQAIGAIEFERTHFAGVEPFPDKLSLLEHTLRQVPPELNTWVELGVATGHSIRLIAATARKLGRMPQIHGFDSFLGLPEDFIPGVPKGSFATTPPEFAEDSIIIHQGWFHDTLPKFARTLTDQIGFVHFDADLYSSTRTGFEALRSRLGPSTVLLFDELWNITDVEQHEYRALTEFIAAAHLRFHYLGYNENYTQASIVLTTADGSV